MSQLNQLNPLNDFVRTVLLESVDGTTGVTTPITSGSVTGFLATSNDAAATAADPSLSVAGVYIGGANGFDAGTWLFEIDATVLTPSLIASLFGNVSPYFIVQRTGDIRVYEKLKYVSGRAAVVV